MDKSKIVALLNECFDGEDITSIDIISDNEIEVEGNTYMVYTDEEATEAFKDFQQSLWDDCGIKGFAEYAQSYIMDNFVDKDWFDEAMKESYESYVEDIKHEGNRLQEEMEEANVETEEEYVEHLCEGWDNGIEWYRSNFGDDEFSEVAMKYKLINEDEVFEWVEGEDGRGILASWDSQELELEDGLFAYRTN